MGYLNNTKVTVDAILTKKGRELLARGGNAFNITSFALADDEIDYDLWNQSHPLGDDKMGIVIENLPITEAVPDETQSMKYKLITLPEGTKAIPYIESSAATIGLTTNTTPGLSITLQTKIWNDTGINSKPESNQTYSITLLDNTYVTLAGTGISGIVSGKSTMYSGLTSTANSDGTEARLNISLLKTFAPALVNGKSTKIIITNNTYGSRLVIPITITDDSV